jgi:endonuclease/exonuclease/phosphatase (EEP) superfamily protein YafD
MCCSEVSGLTNTVRAREASIENILAAKRGIDASAVLIAGDLNSTMRNSVYEKIRAARFGDSWLTVHGPISGGTWPSRDISGFTFLEWLLRIDFVFHCAALRPLSAELLPESLGSDHRGIVVSFGDSA